MFMMLRIFYVTLVRVSQFCCAMERSPTNTPHKFIHPFVFFGLIILIKFGIFNQFRKLPVISNFIQGGIQSHQRLVWCLIASYIIKELCITLMMIKNAGLIGFPHIYYLHVYRIINGNTSANWKLQV